MDLWGWRRLCFRFFVMGVLYFGVGVFWNDFGLVWFYLMDLRFPGWILVYSVVFWVSLIWFGLGVCLFGGLVFGLLI